MRNVLGAVMDTMVLCVVAAAVVPAAREEAHWRWAVVVDSPPAFDSYLAWWPGGRHVQDAIDRHDEASWAAVRHSSQLDLFEAYLRDSKRGRHAAEANQRIEGLRFEEARSKNTIRSLQTYVDLYPDGRFAADATSRQRALRDDDKPFRIAMQKATPASLSEFLAEYPGHASQARAQSSLRDLTGRDVIDLLRELRIQLRATGAGPAGVTVQIKLVSEGPLVAKVPPGTLFNARSPNTRQMIATGETLTPLRRNEWVTASVAAAGLQRQRNLPQVTDVFIVQRPTAQNELATKLVPVLQGADAPFEVLQAAVWIVAENADYAGLGALPGSGRARAILETEAALAMRLVDQAGIDITKRAIWRDRAKLLGALAPSATRTWLDERK